METIKVISPVIRRKNAERLSILKLKFIKGMLLLMFKLIVKSFAETNLYIIDRLNIQLAITEKIFDRKFDM